MAVILVNRPTVEGDRVYFSWTTSEPLEKVKASKFYVQYVGVPVNDLPIWVHFNTVVGLLLARLSEIPEKHLVVLDSPIPRWVVDLWGTYHDARNVTFVADEIPAEQTPVAPLDPSRPPHFGLLFGGGKDSLFALDLLREAFPDAKISLISYSIPAAHVHMDNLEQRRSTFAVKVAAANYGADVISIRTDVRAVFEPFFHTELYTASLFPMLHLVDLSAVTFSYEYCHYWTRYAQGDKFLSFRKSRPEHCAAISRAYSKALGRTFDLFNANAFMTELSSFLYLSRKRPEFAAEVMMCESTDKPEIKWCRNCTKCAEYSMFSAFAGSRDTQLPLSDFLADSRWVSRIIPEARKQLAEFPQDQAKRFFTGLTFAGHIDSFSHVVQRLAANPPADLDAAALENLRLLAEAYGRDGLDAEEFAYEKVLKATWPKKFHAPALSVLRSRIGTRRDGPKTKFWGTSAVVFEPQVTDRIPDRHEVDFGPEAFAGEFVALGRRLTDESLLRQATLDDLAVRPLGAIRPGQLMIVRSSQWIDVHSNVSGPRKGDGFSIGGRFTPPVGLGGAELSLRVLSPYFHGDLSGWCIIRLHVNRACVLEEDLTDFGGSFFVTIPTGDEAIDFRLEAMALKDCMSWGWGKAMRLCIEQGSWQASRAKAMLGIRLTYPKPSARSSQRISRVS